MRKNMIRGVLAVLILLMAQGSAVFAEKNEFSDVNESTAYYEDISELFNEGFIKGYEDGKFYPDNKISVAEGITLAERVFGDVSTLPEDWSGWSAYPCKWDNHISLSGYPFRGDYNAEMSYETASELLLKLNNISILKTEMWGKKSLYPGFSEYTDTMRIRGYADENGNVEKSYYSISRSEFCHMIMFIKNYDGNSTIPKTDEPIITPVVFGGDPEGEYNSSIINAQNYLIYVPEAVRISFAKDDGKIVLVPYDKWNNITNSEDNIVGIYCHQTRTVYVRMGYMDSIPHEIGHYVQLKARDEYNFHKKLDSDAKFKLGKFKKYGDNYYMTNDSEFFAEAFEVYCMNTDALEQDANEIYMYIDDVVKKIN